MTDQAREYWDRESLTYASEEGHRRFGGYLALFEEACWAMIDPLRPSVDEGMILEAGCGTGRWVTRLAPLGHRMVPLDLSPEMVRQAQAKVERMGLSDRVAGYYALDICNLHALSDASFDLVLALGGPLTLCRDARLAAAELHRVTRPGGHVVCDAANRYRTALDLVQDGRTEQLLMLLEGGGYARRDGLTDHRFGPAELAALFESVGMEAVRLAAVCPWFSFLPSQEQVRILDDDRVMERMREDPAVVALSGRLLVVARRGA